MKQESVKNVLLLLAGAFVYSVGTQYFIVPAQIAPGGAVGIAQIGRASCRERV